MDRQCGPARSDPECRPVLACCCTRPGGLPRFLRSLAVGARRGARRRRSPERTGRRGAGRATRPTAREAMRLLRQSLGRPGTQLGFWSHFVTQSSGTMITSALGLPLPHRRARLRPGGGAGLLVAPRDRGRRSPDRSSASSRHASRCVDRISCSASSWSWRCAGRAVLAWPDRPPIWLVVVLILARGRRWPRLADRIRLRAHLQPARSLGSANGVVNVGGFLASFLMMYLVGVVLDVLDRMRVAGGAAVRHLLVGFVPDRVPRAVRRRRGRRRLPRACPPSNQAQAARGRGNRGGAALDRGRADVAPILIGREAISDGEIRGPRSGDKVPQLSRAKRIPCNN